MRSRPAETINFLDKSSKERSQGTNGSNERNGNGQIKLIDQISTFNLESVQTQNQMKKNDVMTENMKTKKKKPLKIVGINNRNRMVDATMTAYKLLESAFIN